MAKWLLYSYTANMKEAFGLVNVRQMTKVGYFTSNINILPPKSRLECCKGLEFCCCKLVIPVLTSHRESYTPGSVTPRKQSQLWVWLAVTISLNLAQYLQIILCPRTCSRQGCLVVWWVEWAAPTNPRL